MSDSLLSIQGLESGYGDVKVLWGLNMEVHEGEITAVIGSNGAGKSTLMRTISGLVKAQRGEISFLGKSLAGATPGEVLSAGIAHVPEGRRLFKGLSVRDNLCLGRTQETLVQQTFKKTLRKFTPFFRVCKSVFHRMHRHYPVANNRCARSAGV